MQVRRIAATTTAAALVAASAWSAAPAAAATAGDLVAGIFAPWAASFVTGSSLTSPSGDATWVRTAPAAGFPTRTGGSYAMLSTGHAGVLDQYTSSYEASTPWASSTTRGGAYDVTTLSVTLDVPATANCLLGVTFRFLTEEFPDFTGGTYNDAFIAEVGESTWRIDGTTIIAPNNFAYDPSGRVISVNSGLFDSDTAAAEATGTVFGGATPKLTAQVPLTPGVSQTLHFTVFDQGDSDLDSAVLIDNLRIGTVGDPDTQCVAGATTNPLETLVSATPPTKNDLSGTAQDTYTIPSSDGITYSVGGSPVAAGTYPGSGTVVVTATAQPGYVLSGASQFTLVFTDITEVSATEPTWTDVSGTANDTYTIPSVTGVQYSVGGTPVSAGTYPATGTVTVSAAAASAAYTLTGATTFTHTFSSIVDVSAVEPTWYDTYGTDEDTITIPSVTGVRYFVNGTPFSAGTYPVGTAGTVTVNAMAASGYRLTGASEFTYTFTDIRLVSATEPTWYDTYGTAEDTYTIPSVTGVQYSVDGDPVAPGTYPASGTVTVDAAATAGHELSGPSQFTYTFTNIVQVSATEPTAVDTYGTADDTYTIPSVTGVQYSIGGSPVAAGTYPGTGTVVVDAAATAGYELSGTSQFTIVFTNIVLATPVEPAWTDVDGTASDTYTIPAVDGVVYTVEGGVVAPGTYPASGTVTVVATAAPGYELTGTTVFSQTFTDITHVSALAPTTQDEPGTARDRVTIPAVTGVAYLLDGTPIAAGKHALTGDLVVTAQAADARHVLVGTSRFDLHLSDADVPGQPVVSAAAGPGSVELTWSVPAGEPTGYDVQKSLDGTSWAAAGSTAGVTLAVTGLQDGRTVTFRVRGVNALGAGAWSAPVAATPVSLPGAPSVTAVESGNRSLRVTFDAPSSNGGAAIERYEYTHDGGATWATAAGSPVTLTGLVNGTEYGVQVRAVNAVGAGPASEPVTGTPRPAPVLVPGEDGTPARPRVSPGIVRGWVGDETTPLVVGIRDGRRTVSGPGFDVVLGGADSTGAHLPVDPEGRIIVGDGGFVDVSGSGFAPGERVDAWLFSTPVLLGTVTVEADGTFAERLALPLGVLPGEHTLQLNGARADGELVSIAAGIVVRAAVDEPADPVADDTLPVTGAGAGSGALLALWLLGTGACAVVVARRRTRRG